jgi:hypothetical protein
VASLRSGSGPYRFDVGSEIFAWTNGEFVPFQTVPTFAAKQWKHWRIGDRDFLGLAQGVEAPGVNGHNRESVVYEWDGSCFVEHQRIPSRWAYNWHPFAAADSFFVAHAEHLGPSVLYRWDGQRLVPHQRLIERGGRAFATFERDGRFYLLAAGLLEPPVLMCWDGERFQTVQVLEGLGARELALVRLGDELIVVRVNFIAGTPEEPQPLLDSHLYAWSSGRLELVGRFPTCGGTDAAPLSGTDEALLVVANSLTPELRFGTDTVLYSISSGGDSQAADGHGS